MTNIENTNRPAVPQPVLEVLLDAVRVLTRRGWITASLCACGILSGCATFTPPAETAAAPAESTVQHVSLARLQERQGDVTGARRIYEQVLRANPNEPTAHHRLGVLEAKSGNFDLAISHFEAAQQAGTASAELMNDLGYACYLAGDLPGAERWLREAVRIDARHTSAQNNLGLVLGALGRDRESLAAFRMAGSLAEAYNNMAWTLTQRGDIEGARRHYLMALDADPKLKNAAEALVALAHHEDTMTRIARRDDRRENEAASAVVTARTVPPQPRAGRQPARTAAAGSVAAVSGRGASLPVRIASARTPTRPSAVSPHAAPAEKTNQVLHAAAAQERRWAEIAPPQPVAAITSATAPDRTAATSANAAPQSPVGRERVSLADFAPEIRPAVRPAVVPQIRPGTASVPRPEPLRNVESQLNQDCPEPRVEREVGETPLPLIDPHALPAMVPSPEFSAGKPESTDSVTSPAPIDFAPDDDAEPDAMDGPDPQLQPVAAEQTGAVEAVQASHETVVDQPFEPAEPQRVDFRRLRRASFAAQMGEIPTQLTPVGKASDKPGTPDPQPPVQRKRDRARFGPEQ